MDLEFYVRVRTCEKRVTGKQPLDAFIYSNGSAWSRNRIRAVRGHIYSYHFFYD